MNVEMEGVTSSSSNMHVTGENENSAVVTDLEDGEIEDGEIRDEKISAPEAPVKVEKSQPTAEGFWSFRAFGDAEEHKGKQKKRTKDGNDGNVTEEEEESVRTRRGEERRQNDSRGRGLQNKDRGIKGGKRPNDKRHQQRNMIMQDTRQQGPYSHKALPPRLMKLCKFYLNNCCNKEDKCLYMHSNFPCTFFHTGLECLAGNRCKFSHKPLTDMWRGILLNHLLTAPSEILGGFARLSLEQIAAMVYNTNCRGKGFVPRKKMQVPIPAQLLAQRRLNPESSDDDGSPLGNCNHGAPPMPYDNTPQLQGSKQEHVKSMKKPQHKRRRHSEAVDMEHRGSGDYCVDTEEKEYQMKSVLRHKKAGDHARGKASKVKLRFYQETLSSADEVAGSPKSHREQPCHKRSKSKSARMKKKQDQRTRTKQEKDLDHLAGYSPSRLTRADSDGSYNQQNIIRIPSPAAMKLDPPLKLTDDKNLEIVIGPNSDQESYGRSTPPSNSKHQENNTRKEQADAGDSSYSFDLGIPANLPKKQQELLQQHKVAKSSSKEQEDDGHRNEEYYVLEEEEASLADVLNNLQQQTKSSEHEDLGQPSAATLQRSMTPPLPPSSSSGVTTSLAELSVVKLADLSSINMSNSVSKLLPNIRKSSAINMPQASSSAARTSVPTSTLDKYPTLSHGAAVSPRDPRLRSRDLWNQSSVLLSPSSSNSDPRTIPAEEPHPASCSTSSSYPSIYSSAITLPLTVNVQASEREVWTGDTDLHSYLPPAISDKDLRQCLTRFGDTDLHTGPTDVDLRSNLSLPFKPLIHTPATEIDASINSHPLISYKVVPISIPRPNYSGFISVPQVCSDPRLNRLCNISSSTTSSTTAAIIMGTSATLSPSSSPQLE